MQILFHYKHSAHADILKWVSMRTLISNTILAFIYLPFSCCERSVGDLTTLTQTFTLSTEILCMYELICSQQRASMRMVKVCCFSRGSWLTALPRQLFSTGQVICPSMVVLTRFPVLKNELLKYGCLKGGKKNRSQPTNSIFYLYYILLGQQNRTLSPKINLFISFIIYKLFFFLFHYFH